MHAETTKTLCDHCHAESGELEDGAEDTADGERVGKKCQARYAREAREEREEAERTRRSNQAALDEFRAAHPDEYAPERLGW